MIWPPRWDQIERDFSEMQFQMRLSFASFLKHGKREAAAGLAHACKLDSDMRVDEICQNTLPVDMREAKSLPGIAPLRPHEWLLVDECYGAQMAKRRQLLRDRPEDVLAMTPRAGDACVEALAVVLEQLAQHPDFEITRDYVRCPDGHLVDLHNAPLDVLGQIVQDDICILEKPSGSIEHILTAAVLCFPAGWTLTQKIGRPLVRIHAPVLEYKADLAKRVQRLFDGVQAGRPLWRFNRMWYEKADLFQPHLEDDPREDRGVSISPFFRSERQCIVRLPQTQAVVFSIHTYVLRAEVARKLIGLN